MLLKSHLIVHQLRHRWKKFHSAAIPLAGAVRRWRIKAADDYRKPRGKAADDFSLDIPQNPSPKGVEGPNGGWWILFIWVGLPFALFGLAMLGPIGLGIVMVIGAAWGLFIIFGMGRKEWPDDYK